MNLSPGILFGGTLAVATVMFLIVMGAKRGCSVLAAVLLIILIVSTISSAMFQFLTGTSLTSLFY